MEPPFSAFSFVRGGAHAELLRAWRLGRAASLPVSESGGWGGPGALVISASKSEDGSFLASVVQMRLLQALVTLQGDRLQNIVVT